MNMAGESILFVMPKYAVILGIIAFLVMSFWGLYSMPMDENGKMADCPFTSNSASLCQMSFAQHIAQWQQLFTAMPDKNPLFFAFALLCILLIALALILPRARDKMMLPQKFRNYLYKQRPEIKLFNHLIVTFSQGILNPRIYA